MRRTSRFSEETAGADLILDFEEIVVGQYWNARSPVFGLINDLARPVKDAISGAYERPWRT